MDRLQLLANSRLLQDSKVIVLNQARLDELVTFLALHPGNAFTRAHLAYVFWPESGEKQSRTNLRNVLFKLKRIWPTISESIEIERETVRWRMDAPVDVDVHRFEHGLEQVKQMQSGEDRGRVLEEIASLYQGDLLPGCHEDWALQERQRLHGQFAQILEWLVGEMLDLRRYDDALTWAKRLHTHDPVHESTYRYLMKTYIMLGDRPAALRTYHTCTSTLQTELGVEPSTATRQAYEQLLSRNNLLGAKKDAPEAISRPQLVGRRVEWQTLLNAWRQTEQGQACLVIILGEAGIGKTRLAEELIDWVGRQGYAWASSRSYAARGTIAYAPISEWLRDAHIRSSLDRLDDLWRVEIHRLLPDLMVHRPELPPPGPLLEDWQRHRFYQAIVQTLQSVPAPLLLHLDDLQWSDSETLSFLLYLLQSMRDHPLLLVGGIRVEEMNTNPELDDLLNELRRRGHLVEVNLGPLSVEECAQLAEQTAGERLDRETMTTLFSGSEGHPLLLVETIRAGLIGRDHDVSHGPTELQHTDVQPSVAGPSNGIPPKIYTLMVGRLNQLSEPARQLASAAAVIGRSFSFDLLRAAGGYDELALVDALDELWQRRIVRQQSGDDYDFNHDRIREVAYLEISPSRRRLIHGLTAHALEEIHRNDLDEVAGQLANHYEQAGDRSRACKYYAQAAQLAVDRHALLVAETLFEAALNLVSSDESELRLELLQRQASLYEFIGQDRDIWLANLEAQDIIFASLPNHQKAKLTVQMHLQYAVYFLCMDDYPASIRSAETAVALAESVQDIAGLAQAHLLAGNANWLQTKMVVAVRHFELATGYARQVGDQVTEAKSLEHTAGVGMFTGRPPDQLRTSLYQALALAKRHDQQLHEASLHNKFGFLAAGQGMGELFEAEKHYLHALAMSRETGNREMEKLLLTNLGALYTQIGDYRRATEHLLTAAGGELSGFIRTYIGRALMQQGRVDAAHQELTRSAKNLHQIKYLHAESRARIDLGLLLHLRDESRMAVTELRNAVALTHQYGDTRQAGLASVRLGYALEDLQRWTEALNAYQQGYELHQQVAQEYYAMNALAGLARLADRQGNGGDAYALARQVWETLQGQKPDATIETVRTYRTCYEILFAHGDPQAHDVFDTAWHQLQQRVATIDAPRHADLFWQIPDHRYFLYTSTTFPQSNTEK